MRRQVFISHSHSDKPFARRIARRLCAYGVDVWLDENELELGGVLTRDLKKAIRKASHVLVVASEAASTSHWVGLELEYARKRLFRSGPVIIPLFIADTQKHPRFDGFLGKELIQRHLIDVEIASLARSLIGAAGPPDTAMLKETLSQLSSDVPVLRPIIAACLGEGEMPASQLDRLRDMQVAFDDLEFALVSGYEAAPPERRPIAASIAAYAFRFRGAGSRALYLDLVAKSEGRPATITGLVTAIGEPIRPEDIDAALFLLASASPPHDQALASFVSKNFNQCTDRQRATLVHLMTEPDRGPGGFSRDAAYELLSRMPENSDLQQLWHWWIENGRFEGEGKNAASPLDLFILLGEGFNAAPQVWEPFLDVLRYRVRRLARTRDKAMVTRAIDYLMAAADNDVSHLDVVRRAVGDAPGSAEWKGWEHEDEMRTFVFTFLEAAATHKRWDVAFDDFEARRKTSDRHNKILRKLKDKPDNP